MLNVIVFYCRRLFDFMNVDSTRVWKDDLCKKGFYDIQIFAVYLKLE